MVFLAISSGITKVMLMPQEVEFFGAYGFSNPILILFGASQLIGGFLLIFAQLRVAGALIIGTTFLISLVLLVLAANILFSVLTIVAMWLLGLIIRTTINTSSG